MFCHREKRGALIEEVAFGCCCFLFLFLFCFLGGWGGLFACFLLLLFCFCFLAEYVPGKCCVVLSGRSS